MPTGLWGRDVENICQWMNKTNSSWANIPLSSESSLSAWTVSLSNFLLTGKDLSRYFFQDIIHSWLFTVFAMCYSVVCNQACNYATPGTSPTPGTRPQPEKKSNPQDWGRWYAIEPRIKCIHRQFVILNPSSLFKSYPSYLLLRYVKLFSVCRNVLFFSKKWPVLAGCMSSLYLI